MSLQWRRNTSLNESNSQVDRAQHPTEVEIDLEHTIHTAETDSAPHLYRPGETFMVAPGSGSSPEQYKAAFEKSDN